MARRHAIHIGDTVIGIHEAHLQTFGVRLYVTHVERGGGPGGGIVRGQLWNGEVLETATLSVPRAYVVPMHTVPVSTREAYLARRAELLENARVRDQEFRQRRRAKQLAEYVAKRHAAQATPPLVHEVRVERDAEEQLPEIARHEWRMETQGSALITIYNAESGWYLNPPKVNWAACGSVSPEEALQFANALRDAAELAMTLRAEFESTQDDLRAALETEDASPAREGQAGQV